MRYLMFTGNDGRTEVHRYEIAEIFEIFGDDGAEALATRGHLIRFNGIWIDMEHAAKKRAKQVSNHAPTDPDADAMRRAVLAAANHLGLDSLETRNSDSLDFSEHAVWQIKKALEAAYQAGYAAAQNKDA
jgi:hypothetical protein